MCRCSAAALLLPSKTLPLLLRTPKRVEVSLRSSSCPQNTVHAVLFDWMRVCDPQSNALSKDLSSERHRAGRSPTVIPAVRNHRNRSQFIAPRGMHTPPRSCTPFADTPKFRSSVNDPLPRDRGQLHIEDMFERKPANYRTHLGSDPYSRRSRGKSACNRAAHRRGTFGLLPNLPPTSRAAWRRDANRITEKTVAWRS
jgi:hypothetical protein